MKITHTEHHLTIDFEKTNSTWALLVIDDKWDSVYAMVCGETDKLTNQQALGLEESCTNSNMVLNYWQNNSPSSEVFERALLLLPWMIADADGYGSITLCGFPDDVEKLKSVLECNADHPFQWAALIDVRDTSQQETKQQRFVSTWEQLDAVGHPRHSRAKFTRGGIDLPSWTVNIATIRKEPPTGGYDAQKQEILKWLSHVRGVINCDLYQQLTNNCCHKPTDLALASASARKALLDQLSSTNDDLYGVWRWCEVKASEDPISESAFYRWLASKAFQTSPIGMGEVPLTAVIAICEGARYLANSDNWNYQVSSDLYGIPSPINEHGDPALYQINKIKALGCLHLKNGNYGGFASALRDWLVQPEQFENGNVHLQSILVQHDVDTSQVQLKMIYSGPFPTAITNYVEGDRRGRVGVAWDKLSFFALSYFHNDEKIVLTYSFSDM